MDNAKKCDRCGGYFDNSSTDFNYIILNNSNWVSNKHKTLDLCPSCMKALTLYLQHKAAIAPFDGKENHATTIQGPSHEC